MPAQDDQKPKPIKPEKNTIYNGLPFDDDEEIDLNLEFGEAYNFHHDCGDR